MVSLYNDFVNIQYMLICTRHLPNMDAEDSEAVITLCSSEDGENELVQGTDISSPVSSNEPHKDAEEFELQPTAPRESSDKDAPERPKSSSLAIQQHREKRVSPVAQLLVEIFSRTGERQWSVGISSLVASIPSLLVGLSIAFPSNAVLDLTGEATELPQDYLLSTLLLSLFAVRPLLTHCPIMYMQIMSCVHVCMW